MKVFVTEKVNAVRSEDSAVTEVLFQPKSNKQDGLETYLFHDIRMIAYTPNAVAPAVPEYLLYLPDAPSEPLHFDAAKYSITAIGG